MQFDSFDFFNQENKNTAESEIKEIFDKLTKYLKDYFKNLEFYYEINILKNEGITEKAAMEYFVSAPHLRGYRKLLFTIKYNYLGEFPIELYKKYTTADDFCSGISLEKKDSLFNALNTFIKEPEFGKILVELSRKTL